MAIIFNKLKDPKLNLLDKFTFGKFQMCRVCDILQEDYDYVLWLNDKNPQLFSTEVITEAKQLKQEAVQKQHYEEEDKPFENANPYFTLDDWDDDIPF
jgi:hypothetical protein